MTTSQVDEEIDEEINPVEDPSLILNKPFSGVAALGFIALIVALVFGCVNVFGGSDADPPRPAAANAESAPSQAQSAAPAKELALPAKNVPLRPPPSDACVGGWCGKQIGFASIIVDVGYRQTDLPKRAWVIAVATAMQESTLKNQSNKAHKASTRFPFDKEGDDHDSVGLFQQRPDQGWGSPEELMDPRIAAAKFYGSFKDKVKGWDGWENAKLTDIAQRVQRSKYPEAYQKHEANAAKIVDLVLQHQYTPEYYKKDVRNNWFVMTQCGNPKILACRSVQWELIKPVAMNRDVFGQAYPKAKLNGHIGDWKHQNASPEDHTSIAESCYNGVCNALGWVYAQDFGNGDTKDSGFDLNRFVRWLVDKQRGPNPYKEIKYIISTIPENKKADGGRYWGSISVRTGWKANHDRDADHPDHVHISYKPGSERADSTIMADYLKSI